ncbi:putative repeat protein (TIGR01451 family)/fimbrial isopeptide formation D2 family protein [Curtobacterium sp. PhB130]|uniref:isopeptide-forming domain-containing fimbrial protein n=1 Tax=Curtobacterium sp. PhB130 TaxID=2485178 RepID=UPI000F4D09CE|nr:isopeptide-forming domain-containing fimbrial protein [Curtobacterium sp. PhB130]ROS77544.1 putative repeat protein (TIGR01451 family)/fimbrial isopeptide formation D2 family protein [Curtobacterium sp. PhB130]
MRLSFLPARPRALAMIVVVALVTGLLAVFALAQPAAAASSIGVTAKADATVLSGAPATVTLTAKNTADSSGGTDLYNLGYSYTLPVGVSFAAGSAKADGTALPAPVITTLAGGGTLLVFSNVSDLVSGDQKSITFQVTATDAAYPVGTTFSGSAQIAANSDARNIPTFDATGTPATNFTNSATATSNTTAISAIKVTKAEASSENELVRGVHNHPTVYTLTVQNTSTAPSTNVTVTDYLPAGLEFLQCGAIDNTTSGPEYTGAASLQTATSANATGTWDQTACLTPQSVTTVNTVAGQGSAVFTKVVWTIPTLTNTPVTIKYLAAVPLLANTMTFSGQGTGKPAGAVTAPAATSFTSEANLDNNNGASTRQNTADATSNGRGQTNLVDATGTYTGKVGGTATSTQTASTSLTVEAMDLAVAKSVSTPVAGNMFAAGKLATYSLLVRTSEYESSKAITLTDTLGDGLCPVFPAGTPTTGTFPADCDPAKSATVAGSPSGATITSVDYLAASGKFVVHFTLADQPVDGSTTVTYKALMRNAYSVTGSGGPTAAGDSFDNTVAIAGTSTGVHGDTGDTKVVDDSTASIVSNSPKITKSVLPRSASDGVTGSADCTASARTSSYVTSTPADAFQLGDVVCFKLEVDFPAGVQSRNATITDMLPVHTTAAGSSWVEGTDWTYGTESSVPKSDVALKSSSSTMGAFSVGHTVSGATGTYVDGDTAGASVVLYVAARIATQTTSSTTVDLADNLMKFSQQNTAGSVTSLRTDVGYNVAGAPTATLAKDIVSDSGTVTNPAATTEGQTLHYRLTVGNKAATGTTAAIGNVTVWDALPANVTCAVVTNISDGGVCATAPTGAATKFVKNSYITWTVSSIAAAATKQLTYDFAVPTPGYVGTAYQNSASVTRFTTATDSGTTTTWIPTTGTNSTFAATPTTGQGTAPNADATRLVTIPAVAVAKSGSAVAAATTNLSGDTAAPGQALAYTYSATVPAATSVGNGTLVDPLPTGVVTTAASAWTLTFPDATTITVPATAQATDVTGTYGGQTFTLTGTGNSRGAGAVLFPATFDNAGASTAKFSVTVTDLRVTKGVGNYTAAGYTASTVQNTATFTSTPTGGTASSWTASKSIAVQAPKVAVTKTDNLAGKTIAGGDTVTWTLTAKNSAATADARSTVIADCFPNTLTLTSSSATESTPTDAQKTALGTCPTGTTLHTWNVGTIAAGASATITVTATVKQDAPAGQTYTNTARALTSSLDTDYATANTSYVQVVTASDDVKVTGPSIVKTLTAPTWNATTGAPTADATTNPANTTALSVRAGDTATYTITTTVPANVAIYDGRVTDTLPKGLTAVGTPTATASNPSVAVTPSVSSGVVTAKIDDIPTGLGSALTITVSIPVRVGTDQAAGTALSNTAAFAYDRTAKKAEPTDATVTSNVANASVVTPSLAIAKTATVAGQTTTTAKAEPGQQITYTVTVTSSGSPAYGTTVSDCVPDGIVVDGTTISDGGTIRTSADCAGGVITWPVATFGTTTSVQHTYRAVLAEDTSLTGGVLTNTATTGTYSSLPNGDGGPYGPATAKATVTPSFPNVAVAKSNDTAGGLSYVGVPSDFTVTFTNTGSAAKSVSAKDVLPAGWVYTAGSATTVLAGGASTTAPDPTVDGTTLTWSNLGPLGANQTLTLHYRAAPTAKAASAAGTTVQHTNHVTATVTDASGGTGYDGGDGSFTTYPKGGTDATADASIAAADLSVVKTATTAQVVAGATTTKAWTIVVTNNGGDAAHGTTVVDSTAGLPSGATLTPTGTGWTCTPTDGTWTCVNGAVVAKGDTFPELDVTLTLPANAPLTAIRNTATIAQGTGQTFDPNAANDADSASVTPVAIADLAITKTALDEQAAAGGTTSWTLSVQNVRDAGEQSVSDARGTVTVTDTLPDTVTLQSATAAVGSGWTCDTDGNTVTCTRDGLANGTTAAPITVTALVKSAVTADQTVKNTATVAVGGTTTDPKSSNDTSTTTTTVDDTTSLTIAKAFTSDALVAGKTADWTMTVENTGTADARNVVVTDALESGTSLRGGSQTDGDWTCTAESGDTASCALDGTLQAGATTSFTITVTTPADLTGTLANTAEVSADNAATQEAGTSSEATQTAGLSVTKTADVERIDAGQDVTYTVRVANPDGPSDLPAGAGTTPSVRVQDTLPAGVQYVGLTDGTTAHWALESNEDGVLTLVSTDGIAVGAEDPNTIGIVVHVPASFTGSSVVNTATAAPVTAQGATAHDSATVDVTTEADLSITKTRTSAASADAGTDVTYDVTVTNDGPSDAQRVTWADTAPAGMTVTAVTTDDDAWQQGDDVTTWSTDTFANDATTTFHVTATIASGTPAGTLRNTATVSSATDDPDTADDTSGDDVDVTTHASLTLSKTPVAKAGATGKSAKVTAGAEQVWYLHVANTGPSDEQPDTVVTDQLPEGMTFVSASSDGAVWTCDGVTDTTVVTCTLPTTIVAGDDAPGLWITTAVASGFTAGSIENRASITSQGTPAPNGTDADTATADLPVDAVANVQITIGHSGTAVIGKDLPETVQVRNAGVSDADTVTATYTLPKGLTYVSTEADAAWTVTGVVTNADGSTTVSFALTGTLPAGALAPAITVHQTPTAAAYPGVTPTATVATSTTETTLADNDADDELAVAPASSLSVTKTHTGAVVRGETVGYTITVRNDGPTEDPGPVVVTDELPTGLSFVSVDDRGATCTTGSTVACTLSEPLASGSQVAFQLTVRVAADAPDRITNVATVQSSTAQVVPSDPSTVTAGDPLRASDPAPVHAAPKPASELAFTGAVGLGLGGLLALAAVMAGLVLLLLRRRRV